MNIIGICGKAGSGKSTSAGYLVERGFVEISLADEMKRICARVYGWTEEQLWGASDLRNAPDFRYERPGDDRAVVRERFTVRVKRLAQNKHFVFSSPNSSYHWLMNHLPEPEAIELVLDAATGWLTPRYALQCLGTEWARACYVDTWVDILIRNARSVLVGGYDYHRMQGVLQEEDPKTYTGVVVGDVRYPNEAKAIQAAGGLVVKLDRPGAGLQGAAGQHTSETSIDDVDEDVLVVNDGTLDDLRAKILEIHEST